MKKQLFSLLLSFVLTLNAPFSVYAEQLPELPPGPLLLTSVTPDQLSADYWINRLPDPDRLLKSKQQIKELNDDIHAMVKESVEVFKLGSTKPGAPLREHLAYQYKAVKGRGLLDVQNQRVPVSVFENEILPVMALNKIPSQIKIRWGAATRATSVRALPSDRKLLEKPDDIEFDMLQFTLIKLWTPVAVMHESSDGKWFYIQAPYIRGWVKSKDIALFKNQTELKKYAQSPRFLVVTGESIPLFSDPELLNQVQRLSMGTILPLASEPSADPYTVFVPASRVNGGAFIRQFYVGKRSDVSQGFLPFTQRNIIKQAFKLLGARYGWGGMYNGRDCSGFTHDVFLPFGIDMPRGSKEQGFVGTQLGHFEYKQMAGDKLATLNDAIPGITLIRMPHHQMLYLGKVGEQYYAIHCTWAERISMTSDEKNRINQVVVSDLNLNGHSYLGSLFDRVIAMNEIE